MPASWLCACAAVAAVGNGDLYEGASWHLSVCCPVLTLVTSADPDEATVAPVMAQDNYEDIDYEGTLLALWVLSACR